MLPLSPDGTLRLQFDQLRALTLVHLVSGVDEDMSSIDPNAASVRIVTGYTEWVNEGKARLTLGWDFKLQTNGAKRTLARVDEPRSNIVLLDQNLVELGRHATGVLLSQFVDALAWQDATLNAIKLRDQT